MMTITGFDHVAFHVADLERSRRFYGDALGLAEKHRPDFSFPGAWYDLGRGQQIHLIQRPPKEAPYTVPRERHVALRVDDVKAAERRLMGLGCDVQPAKPRPDGAMQLFVRDPDGHVIELVGQSSL